MLSYRSQPFSNDRHMRVTISPTRLLLCAALFAAPPVFAQATAPTSAGETPTVTQIVSISPISLVFGIVGAEYERRIGPTSALAGSANYLRQSGLYYLSGEAKYRYYPQEKALEGFAIGLTTGLTRIGTYGDILDGVDGENDSGTAASLGFALDYQWLLGRKKNFAITLGTGARRLIFLGTEVNGASLTLPTARVSIGRGF